MADTRDLKSLGPFGPCRFESGLRHQLIFIRVPIRVAESPDLLSVRTARVLTYGDGRTTKGFCPTALLIETILRIEDLSRIQDIVRVELALDSAH
jgi:hypothetical protein